MKKKILIACLKDLKANRRVYRQIDYLKNEYQVYTMGFSSSEHEGVPFYKIDPVFRSFSLFKKALAALLIFLGFYKLVYKLLYKCEFTNDELIKEGFDLIMVHDLKPFPLIEGLTSQPIPVLCDAHEYYFDMSKIKSVSDYLLDKLDKFLIKEYLYTLKYITTVGDWIAEQYREKTGAKVDLITSACEYYNLQPGAIQESKIKIIHHGLAAEDRKIETMIQVAGLLDDRFTFDIMLTTLTLDDPYLAYLKSLCEGKTNVKIIPPVKPSEIAAFTNKYDIGLYIIPDNCLSHIYCLPNKFFEYVQARLMIAVSPNYEMKKLTEQYGMGIVSTDYEPQTMAKLLNSLTTKQIMHYKIQCNKAAKELTAANEMIKLSAVVKSII